jgi:phage terminase large subunit-like protein
MARNSRNGLRSVSPPSSDEVTAYARAVLAGEIVAGPYVRDACARHLRDLDEGPRRGLRWDVDAAREAFRFYAEILRLNGGEFEGRPFLLHASQKFIVGSLFGWKMADGYRRFRVAYIEEGKGNGKSPLVAGIGLKMLVADQEPRAEVYAFATKKDQAQILFRDAVAMIDLSPELDAALTRSGGRGKEWNIAHLPSGSFFRTVASDDSQSGPRPHCAIGDEIHEHKSGLMVEMMRAGFKFRRQALLLMITNSGTDRNSICWEHHEYARQVCAGLADDDGFFGYVCALDEGDDPFADEKCWEKANPLLDEIPKLRDYIRERVRESRGMPSLESNVRRLNFCQWVEAFSPWLSTEAWRDAEDAEFDADLLRGRRCYGGLDLSSTLDLTAFVLLFEPTETDPYWRQKSRFWLPLSTFENSERLKLYPGSLAAWRAAGWIEATPGSAVNKLFVLSRLVADCATYNVQTIGYDRWRIADLLQMMADEGVRLPLEPFGQGFKDMAPAVDEYERMLVSGQLRHDGNRVMNWNAVSTVIDTDPAGNRKPTKERSTGRIDGTVAAVMAAGCTLRGKTQKRTYDLVVI